MAILEIGIVERSFFFQETVEDQVGRPGSSVETPPGVTSGVNCLILHGDGREPHPFYIVILHK